MHLMHFEYQIIFCSHHEVVSTKGFTAMNCNQKCKLNEAGKIIFLSLANVLMIAFLITTVEASDKTLGSEFLLEAEEERRGLLLTPPVKQKPIDDVETISSCCLSACVASCFSWFFAPVKFVVYPDDGRVVLDKRNSARKLPTLPSLVVLTITNFLDPSDQLKLSFVNKEFRNVIDERFWEREIAKQRYLIWDNSLPKAKVFFANYFYQRGFGRDPRLEEKIVHKIEDITLLPHFRLAEKALALGFPKGKENYRQAQHKITMSKVTYNYVVQASSRDFLPFSQKLLK